MANILCSLDSTVSSDKATDRNVRASSGKKRVCTTFLLLPTVSRGLTIPLIYFPVTGPKEIKEIQRITQGATVCENKNGRSACRYHNHDGDGENQQFCSFEQFKWFRDRIYDAYNALEHRPGTADAGNSWQWRDNKRHFRFQINKLVAVDLSNSASQPHGHTADSWIISTAHVCFMSAPLSVFVSLCTSVPMICLWLYMCYGQSRK